jgi:hypothetical protein
MSEKLEMLALICYESKQTLYAIWKSHLALKIAGMKLLTINLTPQLELTDEEIVNLYKETEADNGGIREFARAILRKAQEK